MDRTIQFSYPSAAHGEAAHDGPASASSVVATNHKFAAHARWAVGPFLQCTFAFAHCMMLVMLLIAAAVARARRASAAGARAAAPCARSSLSHPTAPSVLRLVRSVPPYTA